MTRRTKILVLLTLLTVSAVLVRASDSDGVQVLETDLHNCSAVQTLSKLKEKAEEDSSPITRQVFSYLFPFESPAWNAVLGTFYISSVPNFILAVIPSEINPNTLNTMTAFATGGLLSDVFLHLVPHAFMGEHQGPGVHVIMVEEKRNIIIGLAVFVGFALFFVMEKTLRVLGGDEHETGHGHTHTHSHGGEATGKSSAVSNGVDHSGLRSRTVEPTDNSSNSEGKPDTKSTVQPSKLSAYLNLFGDFVHNITDGLAMAASFYSSPLIGATTTLACFAHEIPHEIADYSILVRSGFTKRQAMQSQYVTAVGAFIGTFMGIAIHNLSSTAGEPVSTDLGAAVIQNGNGILGTSAQMGDLVIPFVAGGFMYIGAVAVLPTLLAESKSGKQALREYCAMAFGVLCMFLVAWNE